MQTSSLPPEFTGSKHYQYQLEKTLNPAPFGLSISAILTLSYLHPEGAENEKKSLKIGFHYEHYF